MLFGPPPLFPFVACAFRDRLAGPGGFSLASGVRGWCPSLCVWTGSSASWLEARFAALALDRVLAEQAFVPPHMVTPLQISLGNAGLWLAPVQRWIDAEGLETTDDLRCYFRSAVAAGVQGGPLLRLAWEHCSAVGPTDQSLMVLRARREVQVELQQLGRLLAKPPLPLVRRAGRPRRQPKVTDEDSYKAARRAAAEAAVQLSFSWAPLYGLAANSGSTPIVVASHQGIFASYQRFVFLSSFYLVKRCYNSTLFIFY